MPDHRSSRSKCDNSRFKQRKKQLKASDTQKSQWRLLLQACAVRGPPTKFAQFVSQWQRWRNNPKCWRRLPKSGRLFAIEIFRKIFHFWSDIIKDLSPDMFENIFWPLEHLCKSEVQFYLADKTRENECQPNVSNIVNPWSADFIKPREFNMAVQ